MFKIIATNRFKKKLKNLISKNPDFSDKISKVLNELVQNPYTNQFNPHKLSGKLKSFYACSCGYDCRILYNVKKTEKIIILADFGTHDEIY
jgi:mRNA interferase YafQ